jgi:hypothetical protein
MDIPSLPAKEGAPDHKKVTDQNLGTLLALLISLVNSLGFEHAHRIVGAISTFMDFVMTSAFNDPRTLIAQMKEASSYYVNLIRGGAMPEKADLSFRYLRSNKYTDTQRALGLLLVLQSELYGPGVLLTKENAKFAALVFTVLQSWRVISIYTEPNYDTVTDGDSSTADKDAVGKEIASVMNEFGPKHEDFKEVLAAETRSWRFRVSEKGGPNGRATVSATADARAFTKEGEVFNAFVSLADKLGMFQIVGNLFAMSKASVPHGGGHVTDEVLGRLHVIQELGGKARIVAILDYWTQTLLYPLHYAFKPFLKSLPMDGVYDQTSAALRVKEWSENPDSTIYSFDLSAATDRFPLWFQQKVLGILLKDTAAAGYWATLLTGRNYKTADGTKLRYNTGQPMGALTSFNIFTFSHHVAVQIAASRAKKALPFTEYVIIGDDVTINSKDVAGEYKTLMSELDVGISLSKSVLHSEGLLPAGELAKRLFINGIELSTIPVKMLARLPRFGKLAPAVQDYMVTRGFISPGVGLATFFAGAVDKESFTGLLKLNAADPELVGMKSSWGALSEALKPINWYPGIGLIQSDLWDAYSFTLISEQLKRVEALLRQSELLREIIADPVMSNDELIKAINDGDKKLEWATRKLADAGTWDRAHPLRIAAWDEARRVGGILAQLRSGTLSLSVVARRGLLDSLRNSIWSSNFADDDERAQVTYAVFNSSLTNLSRILRLPGKDSKGVAIPRVLEFTIPLLSLNRSYTVLWRLGGGVFVNMVRTRVSTDATENLNKLSTVLDGLDMVPGRPSGPAQGAVASQTDVYKLLESDL